MMSDEVNNVSKKVLTRLLTEMVNQLDDLDDVAGIR